jgi:hypothetical protein
MNVKSTHFCSRECFLSGIGNGKWSVLIINGLE